MSTDFWGETVLVVGWLQAPDVSAALFGGRAGAAQRDAVKLVMEMQISAARLDLSRTKLLAEQRHNGVLNSVSSAHVLLQLAHP